METEKPRIINLEELPKMTLEERVRKALENVEKALKQPKPPEGRNWDYPLKLTSREYLEFQKKLLQDLLENKMW